MKFDFIFVAPIFLLLVLSYFVLKSVAPGLFPNYFWYFALGITSFLFFSLFDFEVVSSFSRYFYVISIVLLLITILIGQVTRGTLRWIPLGSVSIQPSELVRPFLLVYFANLICEQKLNLKRILYILSLMALPLFLIVIQPSLGVAVLTSVGLGGIFLASETEKKYFLYLGLITLILIPIVFAFLQPYQKQRITAFLNPSLDPLGSGYNAIQSTISVGSGKFFGRGLGRGVGTQLAFLPEKQTDFIFASVSEELGFVGAVTLLGLTFLILLKMVSFMENAINVPARIFLSGVFLTFFAQVFVHVGMNMGLLPITGVPYPLVSAGGSSLLATLTTLGIVNGTRKI